MCGVQLHVIKTSFIVFDGSPWGPVYTLIAFLFEMYWQEYKNTID